MRNIYNKFIISQTSFIFFLEKVRFLRKLTAAVNIKLYTVKFLLNAPGAKHFPKGGLLLQHSFS
jgi:hypothetical protein